FNTGGAIAELFEMIPELNRFIEQQSLEQHANLEPQDPEIHKKLKQAFADPHVVMLVRATKVLRELSNVLGLFGSTPAKRGGESEGVVPKLMDLLIDLRKDARIRKDFATGDKIRNALAQMNITLEDGKGGHTNWQMGD